ncbi:MAG: PKD domain-containing protein, partial [Bacteroidota bacterium]
TGTTLANLQTSSISVFVVAKGDAQGGVLAGIFDVSSYTNGFCFGRYTYPGHGDLSIWNNSSVIETPVGTLPSIGFTYKILEGIKTYGDKTELFINGSLQKSLNGGPLSGTFTNGNYVLGFSQGLDYFKGDIAEIIVFTSALNENDRKSIENYLSNKYAPKVNLGPNINVPFGFCSTSLDAGAGFTTYLWSNGATSQTISVSSNGTYWVSVTDIFNVASTDTVMVAYPVMHMHDTLFCAGSMISLSPGLAGGYTYQWSNGPTTPSVNVNSSGSYWVTVSDGVCSKISDTAHVTVDNFPNQVSLGNDTSLCSGNSIHLMTPYPLPPNLNYHWSTSENTSSVLINTTGDYRVTVTDNNGCQAFDTIHVTIIGTAPVVNFSFTSTCSGVPVMFTNNSAPAGTSWNWNFGDGQSSSGENPSHTYTTGGTYIVSLTVFSGACSNIKTDTIIIPYSSVAAFSVGMACINTPYSFVDQSMAGLNDSIISWNWNFGDSSPASYLQNPQHLFTASGPYTVSLSIATVDGCQQSISHNITVVNSAPPPLAFTLYQPSYNSTTSDHIIHFAWNQSINAISYSLDYSTDSTFNSNVVSVTGITDNFYQTTLNNEDKYFWRVIANGICGDNTYSAVCNFSIFSPLSTPGLTVWLKADAGVTLNGNNVLQWNDASGNGNNAIQSNANQQPLFVTDVPLLNHYPTIRFDGVNDLLNGTTIANLQNSSISIFVVAKGESQGGLLAGLFDINSYTNGFCFGRYTYPGHGDLSIWNNSSYIESPAGSLPSTGFTYKILEGIKTYGTKTELFINGTLQNSSLSAALSGPFTNGNFVVGYSQTLDYLKGDIAEIIVFNTSLSANERKAIEDYLNNKYAPKVNLGPDINIAFGFCDTTIDASDRFTAYQWSTGASTQTISVAANGSYSVTATNIFNTNSSDTIRVTYPAMHLHDTLVCAGNSINLTPGLGNGYTYQWSSGLTTSSINVSSAGNYWVTVSDGVCSAVSNTISLAIDNFPNIVSLGDDTSLCSGNSIHLTAPVPLPTDLLYHWSTGQITPLILIDTTGNYQVTVTNSNGCQGKD